MTAATGPMGIPLTGHGLGGKFSTASAATALGATAATAGLLLPDEDRF